MSVPDSLPHTQRPPTLYSLTDEYRQALQELEQCDPTDADDAERVQNVLGMLADEISIKAPAVAGRIAEIETFADMVSDAASRMAQRAARLKRRAESLKAYLLSNLLALPEKQRKQENEEISVAVRKNPPPVEITPGAEKSLPPEYLRDPPKVELPAPVYRALREVAAFALAVKETPFDHDAGITAAFKGLDDSLDKLTRLGALPVVERLPDKKAIADALKAGVEIPGCKLVPSYRLHIE